MIIISIIFNIIAIVVDGNNKVKFAGSKIEKISLIIKIWFILPFKALKAFSLFNLKSYLINLSHNFINSGFVRKYTKYITVATCPIMIYGASTGRPPIHVKINHVLTRVQNIICLIG